MIHMAYTHYTSPGEVRNDPAFNGNGRFLFPLQPGFMSGNTLGTLQLAWYNHIDPRETVAIANYLRNQAVADKPVFLNIYTPEEITADPWKADTCLIFFEGAPKAPTAICNAGGGFAYVSAMQDSFPVAYELSKRGYNAFALIYRPTAQTACQDLARAIAYLYNHADELKIDMNGYSLWGGSAGARMAAWVGTYGTQGFGAPPCPRPAAVIMEYTGLSEVTGLEPPTYNVVGTYDNIANWRTMQRRIERIRAHGTDAEIEVFEGLPHGFGLGTDTVAEGWFERALTFWINARNEQIPQ